MKPIIEQSTPAPENRKYSRMRVLNYLNILKIAISGKNNGVSKAKYTIWDTVRDTQPSRKNICSNGARKTPNQIGAFVVDFE